jgi:hypothetical protein
MREDPPIPATQAEALLGTAPPVSLASEAGSLAHTRPKFPHRRALTEASWRAAHAWIETAYPGGLDAARPELTAKFPELAQNCDRLEQAAQQAASMFESEPTATPDAFQAALRAWEAATLDGLAALDNARSSALCIDCGAEVATVKTGLGQRVCSRCLREGARP